MPFDLQAAFDTCYDEAGLCIIVNFTRELVPPLAGEDAAWADGLLRSAGLCA